MSNKTNQIEYWYIFKTSVIKNCGKEKMPLAKNIKMTQCGDIALGEGNFSANDTQENTHDRSASKIKIYAWFSLN